MNNKAYPMRSSIGGHATKYDTFNRNNNNFFKNQRAKLEFNKKYGGSYPQQTLYPQQSTAPIYPPAMQVPPPQVPPYTDAPPAYSEIYQPRYMHPPQVTGQLPPITTAYPATQMFVPMPQTVPVGAMAPNVPMGYYPMGPVYPPGSTVLVDGGFDAGARFGPGSSASIPPPPPGHAPNAAQLAAMQGANVMMTQRKSNFFMGGSGGGYTIW